MDLWLVLYLVGYPIVWWQIGTWAVRDMRAQGGYPFDESDAIFVFFWSAFTATLWPIILTLSGLWLALHRVHIGGVLLKLMNKVP